MEFALPTVVAALVFILLLWRLHHARHVMVVPAASPRRARRVIVVLDVGDVDPDEESVQRLVREAAGRAFAGSPDAAEVEVQSRAGKLLARIAAEGPPVRQVAYPLQLVEPHVAKRTPEPSGGLEDEARPTVIPRFEPRERPKPKQSLVDSFELAPEIRQRVSDSNDPVQLVRAILEAGGLPVVADRDVIRSGPDAIVVLRGPMPQSFPHDELNQAYLRFRQSGAARGLVVNFGYLEPTEVRKRELLAPELKHAGPEAIQRMADAVAIGANPLVFATGPPVVAAIETG